MQLQNLGLFRLIVVILSDFQELWVSKCSFENAQDSLLKYYFLDILYQQHNAHDSHPYNNVGNFFFIFDI